MTNWMPDLTQLPVGAMLLAKLTVLLAAAWLLHGLLSARNPRRRVLLWRLALGGVLLLLAGEALLPRLSVALPASWMARDGGRGQGENAAMAQPIEPLRPASSGGLGMAPAYKLGRAAAGGGVSALAADAPGRRPGLVGLAASAGEAASSAARWLMQYPMRWLVQSPSRWLIALWAAGALVLALRLAASYRALRRLVRGARPAPEFALSLLGQMAEAMGLRACQEHVAQPPSAVNPIRGVAQSLSAVNPITQDLPGSDRFTAEGDCATLFRRLLVRAKAVLNHNPTLTPRLRIADNLASPFVTGWLRPVIVLPAAMVEERHRALLPGIFAHELAHLASGDLGWMLLGRWVGVALWFHPLAWGMRRAHDAACEEVCDGVAAQVVGGAPAYSQVLARAFLELAAETPHPIAASMIRPAEIVRRIRRLRAGLLAPRLSRSWVVASLVAALLGVGVLGGLKLVAAGPVQEPAPEANPPQTIAAPTPALPNAEVGTVTVQVVDEAGQPIAGVTVTPDGLRAKAPDNGSHYGWVAERHGQPTPVTTDQRGIAVVAYPKHVGDPSRIGADKETGAVSFGLDHPDYCWDRPTDYAVDGSAKPAVLKKGATLRLSGYVGAQKERTAKLIPVVGTMGDQPFGKAWRTLPDGSLETRQLPPGECSLLLAGKPGDGPFRFSAPVQLTAVAGNTYTYDLALGSGTRVEGRLSDSVPRPVKHGRVGAKLSLAPATPGSLGPSWSTWAEVHEDGTFVFESLPAGSLQAVALCDGFVSANPVTKQTGDKMVPYFSYPQTFEVAASSQRIEMAMEPAATCEVTVLDPEGRPLPTAKVSFWPNVAWQFGAGQVGTGLFAVYEFGDEDRLAPDAADRIAAVMKASERSYVVTTGPDGEARVPGLPGRPGTGYAVTCPGYLMPEVKGAGGPRRQGSIDLKPGDEAKITVRMEKDPAAPASPAASGQAATSATLVAAASAATKTTATFSLQFRWVATDDQHGEAEELPWYGTPPSGPKKPDLWVLKDVIFSEKDVVSYEISPPQQGGSCSIVAQLDNSARGWFAQTTGDNVRRQFAMVLNGQVLSAPTIQNRIPSGQMYCGTLSSLDEAKSLVRSLGGTTPFGADAHQVTAQLQFDRSTPEAMRKRYTLVRLTKIDPESRKKSTDTDGSAQWATSPIGDGHLVFHARLQGEYGVELTGEDPAIALLDLSFYLPQTLQLDNLAADQSLPKIVVPGLGQVSVELKVPASAGPAHSQVFGHLSVDGSPFRDRTLISLDERKDIQEIAPVVAGEYDLSLGIPGFRVTPARQHVTVRAGKTTAVRVEAQVDGQIIGTILRKNNAATAKPVTPREIVLKGLSGERKLTPLTASSKLSATDSVPNDQSDVAYESNFRFVELPAGTYEVTIQADGYQDYHGTYQVVPGVGMTEQQAIFLEPADGAKPAAAGASDVTTQTVAATFSLQFRWEATEAQRSEAERMILDAGTSIPAGATLPPGMSVVGNDVCIWVLKDAVLSEKDIVSYAMIPGLPGQYGIDARLSDSARALYARALRDHPDRGMAVVLNGKLLVPLGFGGTARLNSASSQPLLPAETVHITGVQLSLAEAQSLLATLGAASPFGAQAHRVTARLRFDPSTPEATRRKYVSVWLQKLNWQTPRQPADPDGSASWAETPIGDGQLTFQAALKGEYQVTLRGEGAPQDLALPQTLQLDDLAADQSLGDLAVPALGKVRLELTLTDPAGPKPGAYNADLYRDGATSRTRVHQSVRLDLGKPIQEVDCVAPGQWDLFLFAFSFEVTPYEQPLTVRPGETTTVRATLKPDGVVYGAIFGKDDTALPKRVVPRLITLEGPGGVRRLTPSATPGRIYTDHAFHNWLNFYRLPKGAYELTVEAEGYKTYRQTCNVAPGIPSPSLEILMEPVGAR